MKGNIFSCFFYLFKT